LEFTLLILRLRDPEADLFLQNCKIRGLHSDKKLTLHVKFSCNT
jgi:hypothetical protein